jgi:hypothetical protein
MAEVGDESAAAKKVTETRDRSGGVAAKWAGGSAGEAQDTQRILAFLRPSCFWFNKRFR